MLCNHIGDIRVDRIIEQEFPMFDPAEFLPDLTKDMIDPHRSWFEPNCLDPVSGLMTFCMQSYVIRTGKHNILVDTCIGNHKNHPARPPWHQKTDSTYMDALNKAGLTVADIDFVMCTHLHPDHVGWNTQLENGEWVPTFPNARHVYVDVELDWASTEERRQGQDPYAESIAPIVDAGLSWQVGPDAELGDGLRLISTPGHTPGHVSVEVETGADLLVVTGDLLHHQFQLARPDVAEVADIDPALAVRTRTDFFSEQARAANVIAGTHFGVAPVGRIESHRNAWRWTPTPGAPVGG